MILIKILFWLYVFSTIVKIVERSMDHPRNRKSINLGTDLINFIINATLGVGLWFYIWGT